MTMYRERLSIQIEIADTAAVLQLWLANGTRGAACCACMRLVELFLPANAKFTQTRRTLADDLSRRFGEISPSTHPGARPV